MGDHGILTAIVRMSHDRVIVSEPTDEDSDNVRCMKNFLFACVARRMMDEAFDTDMANWMHDACEEVPHE